MVADMRPDTSEGVLSALPGGTRRTLTASEAAGQAQTTPRQVRRWIATGRFPAVLARGAWRIDADAFADFVRTVRDRDSPDSPSPIRSPTRVSGAVSGLQRELSEARERAERAEREAAETRRFNEWLKDRLEAAERDREQLLRALPEGRPDRSGDVRDEGPGRPGFWARLFGRR
jgi:hypothetical protein